MRVTNYDDIAASYDRRYLDEDYGGIQQALLDFTGGRSNQRILEVGCGTGHWLGALMARGIVGWGIDPSLSMLAQARGKTGDAALARARAEDLPFTRHSFDRLFCINAHHHFSDKHRFIQEARRVIRPGGGLMMVALDPHAGADRWWIYDYFDGTHAIDQQRYPSCEQLREWMRESGFAEAHTREVQHLPEDVSASEALDSGQIAPSYTSQLAVLTASEYRAGMENIRTALANDRELRLSADLRVYATYGTIAP